MKKLRTFASRWYVIAVLAAVFTLQSCTKDIVNDKIYSGEELFKGIFFGKGEVNSKINDFSTDIGTFSATAEEKSAIERVQSEIINEITSKHPEFWRGFKEKIESGDIVLIKKALSDGSKLISESLHLELNNDIDKNMVTELKHELTKDKNVTLKQKFDKLDIKYKSLLQSLYKVKGETRATQNEQQFDENAARNVNVHVQTNYWYYLYFAVAIAALAVLIILVGADEEVSEDTDERSMAGKDDLLREEMLANIATKLHVADPRR